MTDNTQQAFITAADLFNKATFPFGTGVTAEATESAAQSRCVRQSVLRTKRHWYHILIPPEDFFFQLPKPLPSQPFPVLHRLMSQKSLSVLFYDEYAQFKWQLATFLNDKPEEERQLITDSETHSFFHKQRELILALPSGNSFISLLADRGKNNDATVFSSFFDYLGIDGIRFDDFGKTRFLIFNARRSITITSICREKKTGGKEKHYE
jgi:hypothetical protein